MPPGFTRYRAIGDGWALRTPVRGRRVSAPKTKIVPANGRCNERNMRRPASVEVIPLARPTRRVPRWKTPGEWKPRIDERNPGAHHEPAATGTPAFFR